MRFLFAGFALFFAPLCVAAESPIDFNRDIRPILSNNCYKCHGPDGNSRKADLRLDLRKEALAAIVPGDVTGSELLNRVTHEDPEQRMPPADSQKTLSDREIELLRRWIKEGAAFAGHWSFQPITKPKLPADSKWARNEIDRFILKKLTAGGMQPSPPADARTLLRRISLDLTGLQPTPAEVAAFEKDPNVRAKVTELMSSHRYGEHMAWRWLDAARYADSDGYESDPLRNMWPWRDWVVDAFNKHIPYDQFIIEQLAGDQLPDASMRQILATGFNRNHRLNNEGGVDPAEWLVEYVADRAETTSTVFMGLTWQCARCHDHKFDPISQKEYYQLFSFFHQLPEIGNGSGARNAPPMLEVSSISKLEELEAIQQELTPLAAELKVIEKQNDFVAASAEWMESIAENEAARKKLPGDLAKKEVKQWDAKLKQQAVAHFLRNGYEGAKALVAKIRALEKQERALKATGAKVMVMGDMKDRRKSFILQRGAFNAPGEEVTAATPDWLPPMDESLPRNRLGLAKWLVDPQHPLTARVAVNRTWERFFGTGLVKTAGDFGSQGEAPSHPELLDFLADRFIKSGWDLQELQMLILTSATYQQSSAITPKQFEKDPENRLLGRGPRYRLAAAVIRDQALSASGLLVEKIGGPPVKPYQPVGLWKEVIKGRVVYKRDTGEKLYRRSLYTLWRRAVKPPMMSLLDANGRDTCAVTLKRTNTPLQALLLLNDEAFVELARGLGSRMMKSGGNTDSTRLSFGMLALLGRKPSDDELKILSDELEHQREYFAAHPNAVDEFLAVGESKPDETIDRIELAAMAAVARVLFNLDETLTKE